MDKSLAINADVFPDIDSAVFEREKSIYSQLTTEVSGSKAFLIAHTSYRSPLEKKINLLLKTVFDILLALLLSVLILSWLIPVMALLIKVDSRGPVFFLQKRNKKNGKIFTCIKFRSMHQFAGRHNKQITRLGRFLRYYHIDELPQLLNVLLGDMSVIGPRPHMISENLKYSGLVERYDYRHQVKPGITGLAQSLGNFGAIKDLKKVEERTRLDIEYIKNWSFGMDLRIIYRTFCLILKSV
jgi:lipopolysaccharide/colanic/teichoic acid biosynthesis glycosyltransferase